MDEKIKIVVIGGPTATGKTKLAVDMASRYGGEIVSADSMQIYKRLNIGSAKPTIAEMRGIKHYLIDELEPDIPFSVADYVMKAKKYIDDIHMRGKLPIITGGTGLYISALVDNIVFSNASPDTDLRISLLEKASRLGNKHMHNILSEIDPAAAASIHENNIKRVIRALEIYYATGKTMTEHNIISKTVPSPYNPIMYALTAERELLYERIDARVDIMVSEGLIDEVRALLDEGLDENMQSMQGIGYKEIIPAVRGELSIQEAISAVKQNSRKYAKRQLTWFGRDARYKWIDTATPPIASDIPV